MRQQDCCTAQAVLWDVAVEPLNEDAGNQTSERIIWALVSSYSLCVSLQISLQ